MPKGGARARSGPAPDPNALRRDRDAGEWVSLPAGGREGVVPAWPLSKQSPREVELWEAEWRRPQAVVWERNGQELEVALFVRAVVEAEDPRASVSARTLVRQQMDSLGISTPGLRSNRWRIVDEAESQVKPRRSSGSSAKERLRVVKDSEAS